MFEEKPVPDALDQEEPADLEDGIDEPGADAFDAGEGADVTEADPADVADQLRSEPVADQDERSI